MWQYEFIALSIIILIAYVFLLLFLLKVWRRLERKGTGLEESCKAVTVIIPARNEAHTLVSCVESIWNNHFPRHLLQILIIDDHSTDQTRSLVEHTFSDKVTCLPLPDGLYGKKQAITFGIEHAANDIILITDADTVVGPLWIRSHASVYADPAIYAVTGSVFPCLRDTIMGRFQFLDYLSVMAATAFGFRYRLFWLASGANMSFRKEIFQKVSGYHGNDHIASGDDVFLFKKIREYDENSILFQHHQGITVRTASELTWSGFLQQRKRWATKTAAYANNRLFMFQGFACMVVLFPFLLILASAIGGANLFLTGLFFLGVKLMADFIFLKYMESAVSASGSTKNFMLSYLLHTVYMFCAFWWAFFPSGYQWKSRRINY